MMEDPLAQLHKRNSNRSEKLEDDRIFELLILAFFFFNEFPADGFTSYLNTVRSFH